MTGSVKETAAFDTNFLNFFAGLMAMHETENEDTRFKNLSPLKSSRSGINKKDYCIGLLGQIKLCF